MNNHLATAVCILLLTTGCSRDPSSDAVARLKVHMSYVLNGRDKKFNNEWKNIRYNVEKSESLASPYTATISAEVDEWNERKDASSPPAVITSYDLTLAYQDGDWILKEAKRHVPSEVQILHPGDFYWNEVVERLQLERNTGKPYP